MNEKKYKPTGRYVMAKEITSVSASGFVFDSNESPYMEVQVVDTTLGWYDTNGYIQATLPYTVGDMLLVPRTAAQKIHIDGEEFLMIRIDDIRAYKNIN